MLPFCFKSLVAVESSTVWIELSALSSLELQDVGQPT